MPVPIFRLYLRYTVNSIRHSERAKFGYCKRVVIIYNIQSTVKIVIIFEVKSYILIFYFFFTTVFISYTLLINLRREKRNSKLFKDLCKETFKFKQILNLYKYLQQLSYIFR